MAGERARFGRDSFLHATIARETNHVLIENAVLAGVETSGRHFHRNCDSGGIADALSEWTGCAFHSGRIAKFRMARRF